MLQHARSTDSLTVCRDSRLATRDRSPLPRSLDIQCHVEAGRAVGEPADRDHVHAGRRHVAGGGGVIPPDASVSALPRVMPTAVASVARSMLSSSTASTPIAQRLVEFREACRPRPRSSPCARRRVSPASTASRHASRDRPVVVLDQHRVVQAEAVIAATASAHGQLLERAQSRRRLARAHDAGRQPLRRTNDAARDVATPDRWPSRFSAVRSAVSSARAGPRSLAMVAPRRRPALAQ